MMNRFLFVTFYLDELFVNSWYAVSIDGTHPQRQRETQRATRDIRSHIDGIHWKVDNAFASINVLENPKSTVNSINKLTTNRRQLFWSPSNARHRYANSDANVKLWKCDQHNHERVLLYQKVQRKTVENESKRVKRAKWWKMLLLGFRLIVFASWQIYSTVTMSLNRMATVNSIGVTTIPTAQSKQANKTKNQLSRLIFHLNNQHTEWRLRNTPSVHRPNKMRKR